MNRILGLILVYGSSFLSQMTGAQPYLDLFRGSFYRSPQPAAGTKEEPLNSTVWNANLTVPIPLKKGGDVVLINPFIEYNKGATGGSGFKLQSHGLMLGFLKKFDQDKMELLVSLIGRVNKEAGHRPANRSQLGTAVLATRKMNPDLSLKAGLYFNREFFGNFFMPLAGLDWKIDGHNNLFGTLPGNLTYEHRISQRFYAGLQFRALTNSYRLPEDAAGNAYDYLRINDNQLGLFGDVYLVKSIVCSLEIGYTIARNYRSGYQSPDLHVYTNWKSDYYYGRLTLAYRLRFR